MILWFLGSFIVTILTEIIHRQSIEYALKFLSKDTLLFMRNYFIILISTSIILFIRKKKMIFLIVSSLWLFIVTISSFLTSMRGMPFTGYDIYSIKDGISIAYKYINLEMLIIVSTIIIIVIATIIILYKYEKNNDKLNNNINKVIAMIVIILFQVYNIIYPLNIIYWDLKESYEKNGAVSSVVNLLKELRRKEVDGYTEKSIEDISNIVLEKNINKEEIGINVETPNILIIQLESFMDPTLIEGISFSEDPIPNFRKLYDENMSGDLNVPVFGGGTVRTEFEVLTGNNTEFLNPGEIPYDTFMRKQNVNSIGSILKNEGYKTHAFHNFEGNFYSRNIAYNNLGFDTFTSVEYMKNLTYTELGWPEDRIMIDYIKNAINTTQEKDFVFAVTVQGHGAYPEYYIENNMKIKVGGDIDEGNKNQLYYYSNQLHETDELIGEITKFVDNLEEDTLVVFYSDHLPALNILEDSSLDKFKTQFAIYSNYNIEKRKFDIESYQLSTLIFELTNIHLGPMELLHKYTYDRDNYEEIIELIQYDILFGKKYFINNIGFSIKNENSMQMGIEKIKIGDVIQSNHDTLIKGKNFTNRSFVIVDGKRVNTEYIDENTLKIKTQNNMNSIVVKQLGKHYGELGCSNEFRLK